ncbi:hypothetical protein [Segnochrobactrum spirostomi]|uniref:Flagellar FliJ protein n=1 Tax=Segnochrobactrum spirostomi TaxID=2608987 RepID=A0A6A7Y1Z6_9HYPH|nr:hypothetical protein [Segnochrobactrum spirostomi]MQT12736.1 hypothetical protein [Segnochrobactrum spirostomi]
MADRTKKVARILKVQQDMQKLADWRLATLRREAGELAVAQEEIVAVFNDDDRLHGILIDPMARRLRMLAAEADRVKVETVAQEQRVLVQSRKLKQTERLLERTTQEEERARERRELEALLDAVLAKRDASLP